VPIPTIDEAVKDRFAALDDALRAAGHLGPEPAPIAALMFLPPDAVAVTWRAAPAPAAEAVIAGWDWTPQTAAQGTRRRARVLVKRAGHLEEALRAVAVAAGLDGDNPIREWIAAFKAEVAAAASLADLKARVAGLPNMPSVTAANVKTKVLDRIDSGDAAEF
jgi:hypothetical protein